MSFQHSKPKPLTLINSKGRAVSTFFIALFTAACLFVPYMIMSEGYFTFYGDFNVQQIPFYQHCHQLIKQGNFTWDFGTDLGANFIGSYSFYLLGSPFFWLTLPFPNHLVPYLMGPLLILKFALSALTAYFYIKRFTKTGEAARLGGLLYAFSGFSIYNIFFNHFHEAIIFFPLLLLAFEMLVTENKRFAFAITVCICAISNYFFFFGMVVFVVIYYFVRFWGKNKLIFSNFVVVVFEAVLGLALAAGILLPSIMAITGNSRISEILLGWGAIMYGKEQIYGNILQCFFFPPDIPARPVFFPGAEVKWSSLGGWLPVFSMVGVFVFFKERKGSWVKRMIGISIFMALVPILNSAFYAFNSSYYARWYYMPILLMCLATVSLTEDENVDWSSGYRWVFGITLAISLVIGLFPQKNEDGSIIFGLFTRDNPGEYTYLIRFVTTCAIALIGLLIMGMLIKIRNENLKSFYTTSLICVCIVSIIYGNVFIFTGRTHSYEIKEVVIDSLIEGEVDFNDDTEFRIDTFDCVDNTAMYLDYSGINAFHSVVPSSVMEYYESLGIERSVASRPSTDYPAIRPLLSVKYLLARVSGNAFIDSETQETVMNGYAYYGTQSGYHIYENKNYIPYGFSYDYYITEDYFNTYLDSEKSALMLKGIVLNKEQAEKYNNILGNYEDVVNNYNLQKDKINIDLDYEGMVSDCNRLKNTSAKSFEINNNGFTATVERKKENLVFFSIPYDEGWSATVNGEPCEIEKVNIGFMAVKVPKGESEIVFTYQTPGLILGIKISVISLGIFFVYVILVVMNRKIVATKNIKRMLYEEDINSMSRANNQSTKFKDENITKKEFLDSVYDVNINSRKKNSNNIDIYSDRFKDK